MGFHFVVLLHLRGVVLDLFLHVEAMLDQVSMVLLQFQQDAVASMFVLLAMGGTLTVILIDNSHVFLVQF